MGAIPRLRPNVGRNQRFSKAEILATRTRAALRDHSLYIMRMRKTTSKITQPVSVLELKLWIAWFLHHCTWEATHLPASREITSCPDPAPIPNSHPPQSNEPHILFVSPQGCPLGGASFTPLPSHLPHAQALTEALDGFLLSPSHFLSHLRVCVELNIPELHRLCNLQKGLGK